MTGGEDGVTVEVADDGPGIAARGRRRACSSGSSGPIRRGRGPAAAAASGCRSSQSIAVAHGGSASVESAVGEGSTFRLVIPRVRELPSATEPLALPEAQR